MKINSQLTIAALGLGIGLLLQGCSSPGQGETTLKYNEQYRSDYDVPPGNYTGRSPFMKSAAEPAAPAKPAPAPAPAAKPAPAPAVDYTSAETGWNFVKLTKRAPAAAAVGETINYDLAVAAQADVMDVVVKDMLPEGAAFVKSEPAATPEGNTLTWKFARMKRGESQAIRVWVTAKTVGELVNCATVTAVPYTCVTTLIGKPQLAIRKTGPETAQLGQEVTYNIVVSNTGNSVAKGVVVTDNVPEGLVHSSNQKQLTFQVGDLGPGQSKTLPVTFKTDRRGKICNAASASSTNAGKVDAEACTTVVKPGLKIVKTGDKLQYLGKTAKYEVAVTNTGDTTLTEVVVTDTPAAQMTLVTAEGATISGNRATWNIGTLKVGESRNLALAATAKAAGEYANSASVSTAQGLRETAQVSTAWRGISGILLEKADDPDPVQVGESVKYTVRITNQGSADDTNVKVVVTFPREIKPISAQGGTVDGQTVTFPAVPRLAPKQAVSYLINAQGAVAGDARTKFTLTSDELKAPVVAEESTTVY